MAAPGLRGSSVALVLAATVLGSFYLRPAVSQQQGQGEEAAGEEEEAQRQRYNFRFVRHARDAPLVSHYNYIVVGGGTAGCPLAATLSERSRVLLLERGGYPYGNRNVSSEYHFADALADTSPRSPAQRFVSEDGVVNARARVLGGGSCLNAGFYTRASSEYVRAAGWDARLVNASYRWVERELVFRPDVPRWQGALREGLLQAGVTPDNGYTVDHVPGTKIGGTIFDSAGRRHTAADFLRGANPRRLTVFLHATVSQVLFRRREGSASPVAYGVVFTDPMGVQHRVYLRGVGRSEVILAAGTLGSPQLLMLSGVGPRAHLEKHGVRAVVDRPMVGQGVADNPMNSVFVPSPVPVALSLVQVVGVTRFGSFIEGVSGSQFGIPLHSRRRAHSFGMFSPMTGQLGTLPPRERTAEAMRRAAEVMRGLDRRAFRGGFILEKILGPLSTGHVELRSTDPHANPAVTFNYFRDPRDVERCVRGIQTIERVVRSRAFSRFTYANATAMDVAFDRAALAKFLNLLPRHPRDTRPLQQYCRDTVMTIWHYHGGCHVGPVVDPDYRVIGVAGLRVVDSSTFKYSPGTNPQATVMMLGRYMGLKIQEEGWRPGPRN
ncbi:protein HOTHEAD-like isoform X1 [Aegilops tauschii subsp. strangulata]|uniref:Glucose-methanol-choline oxidoreductase N-terminal domain-containing protein n=1 Tax=Aegilops tauschii subsp. strangulata TaxID=200361 RepID=A0A453J799_AEGTS|nr:protein HOTHEAD-like isoform X1 [Aegilops tauschii subsp. strangulata]